MSKKPLVSVIISFFNAEKFIEEAIESVFAQTYVNWELLLVDDGSTDLSSKIAMNFAKQYPEKVHYLEHDGHRNRGVCTSRNLGIRHSEGEFIALLDADDAWLSHKLERQLAILDSQYEAAMVYGLSQYWNSWTGNLKDINSDYVPELGVEPNRVFNPPILLTLLYPLGRGTAPCPSDLMFRKEMVERIGGFEESFDIERKFQLYEDQAFLAKVYLNAPVFVSNECWDRYRIHDNSCDSLVVKSGEYHSVRLFFLSWLEDYLTEHKVKDTMVWEALRKALLPYRHPISHRLTEHTKRLVESTKECLNAPERFSLIRHSVISRFLNHIKSIVQRTLIAPKLCRLTDKQQSQGNLPPGGSVCFGDLRRVTPISRYWGFDRGRPIDRYYIENFLAQNAAHIKGRVLEIGDDSYTRRFGGDRVTRSDVVNMLEGNPKTTIVTDLTNAPHIPSVAFDCIIFTQTLQYIYDVRAAIQTLYRILKPGGIILGTFPGISQTCDFEWGDYWYWNFTTFSAKRLFEEVFTPANVKVEAHGNVFAAISFLHGLALEELSKGELDIYDPGYEVTITVRAVKS